MTNIYNCDRMLISQGFFSRGRDISKDEEAQKESMFHTKSMFRKLTMKNKVPPKPNLSRYDGIRFHLKKRGK